MPRRRGRGAQGASLVGLLNADATDDLVARQRVVRLFGAVLAVLFLTDIVCAATVVLVSCQQQQREQQQQQNDGLEDDGTNEEYKASQCFLHAVRSGFTASSWSKDHPSYVHFGDLFVAAVVRCVLLTVLLYLGIRYGAPRQPPAPQPQQNPNQADDPTTTTATAQIARGLSTLAPTCSLESTEENDDHDDEEVDEEIVQEMDEEGQNDHPNINNNRNHESTDDLTEPLLARNDTEQQHPQQQHTRRAAAFVMKLASYIHKSTPYQIQTTVLVTLFALCTYFQVYAGLRVATWDPQQHNNHSSAEYEAVTVPLLCLTVLWINAQAYVFRTLLTELTRETGLYLPPEVHRHPLYYSTSRNLSVHWCDLCHQPMGGRQRPRSISETNTTTAACYRCALCDFDVCLKCAARGRDAAVVGEDVLRGDRGIRVETALSTTGYIKRSVSVAAKELPLLLLSFVLLAGTSLSRLLLPHFQGHIIDKVIPDPTSGAYDKDGFYHFIRVYVGIMILQGAVSTLYRALLTLVSRRLKFTLRNALLEKILAQDVAYFDGTESGRLISRLTNDLDLMMSPIQSSLSTLLGSLMLLAGGLVMCCIKSYRLSMISFVTIGPISSLWDQYASWSKGLAREMLSYWGEGNSLAAQALSHVRTVKAFGCEEYVLQTYSATNQQALNCGLKDAWGNAATQALTGYLDLGSGVLILYFGGLLVYRGEMSVGELVTFQLYWNMMDGALQSLQGLMTSFTRSAAGAEKVFSMWDSIPDIDPARGADIDWNVAGHIRLENIRFFYQMRPDKIVLDNFHLDIPAGKTLALVGRSGGGKSTIINLLLRFYDPRDGTLTLDGRNYNSIKVNQLRRLFGVVTQETELFASTVEENIAYGLDKDDYTMEEVMDAAKKAFAHDFISEMKDGYQTRIGERGNRLSGGQRQRLAIARVFLRKPRIILLDEATSALDETSQAAVQQALTNLIAESKATVVLVAHRLSTVVNADAICVIDQGTVLEQGTHDELVAKQDGVYAAMVAKQLRKKADLIEEEQQQDTDQKRKDATTADKGDGKADDDIDALLEGT